MHSFLRRVFLCLLAAVFAAVSGSPTVESSTQSPGSGSAAAMLAGLAAEFIENNGQWKGPVRFASQSGAISAALDRHAIRLQLGASNPAAVALVFEGATAAPTLVGEERRSTVYNFFSGNHPSEWRTNVRSYGSVRYRNLYEGVDIRVRKQEELITYDLLVSPSTDIAQVIVRVEGASALETAPDGSLLLRTANGVLKQTPPVTLEQRPDGSTRPLASRFHIIDTQRYGFVVTDRDESLPLVIDPSLVWSTLTGGTGNEQLAGLEVARDGSGDLFISGTSYSTDFGTSPTPVQTGRYKAFVARLDASGSHYDFVTFINGLQNQTYPGGMAADASGGVTLVGTTVDLDFPVTPGAYQPQFASTNTQGLSEGDGFVMRLNATGGIVFSTYLGASKNDGAGDVVIDASGSLLVTGTTRSPDFPTTVGAYDRTFNAAPAGDNTALGEDTFIARLSADGSQLTYGTFFGGQTYEAVYDSTVDPHGYLTIAGVTTSSATGTDIPVTADAFDSSWNGSEDGFIARFKLDGNGSADLKYSSFLGGVNLDAIEGIAFDPNNPELVIVAGHSWYDMFTGPFFPTTAGAFKRVLTPNPPPTPLFPHSKTGFVTKFRFPAAGAGTLVWSTFAGGNWEDFLSDIAVDETGAAIVVGGARSWDLQTTRGAHDRTQDGTAGDLHDCFVWKLGPNGDQLLYSSYFGGVYEECGAVVSVGAKVAYLGNNTIALAGQTGTGNLETTPGAVLRFIDELSDSNTPFVAKLMLAADTSGDLSVNAPTLVSPVNNSTTGGSGGAVRFGWTEVADTSGIEGYEYQVSPKPDFPSNFIHYKGSTNTNSMIFDTMAINTPWYWRVRTADRAGNVSDWSPTSTFTLGVSGAPPVINAVQVYPTTVTGGNAAHGVLHLTDPAPPGGLEVTLSKKDPRGFLRTTVPIGIPETITFPAGAISANLPISSVPVTASTPAAIYATVNSVGAKGTITAAPTLVATAASLMLDPFAVTGGNPATGTVTLTGVAPAGGISVPLLSSHPQYARVPSSVTVPAGDKSATFPIETSPVPFSFDVTIEATGGQFAARKLALRTPGARLTSFTLSARTVTGGAALTGAVTFDRPISHSPFPATGDAIVTLKSTHPAVGLSPLVAVPIGKTSATFSIGVRNVPATTDLEIVAAYDDTVLRAPLTVTGTAASLSSLTLNVSTLTSGQGGVGFVNLSAPAPAGHVLVTLSSNNPAITLPLDVTVSSGSTSGLFSFGSLPVQATTQAAITATYGASSRSASVTVNPSTTANLWVTSLSVSPATVTAGTGSTATVVLNAPAPSGGATVQLSSMNPASVPASITVPAGSTTASFPVSTSSVSSTTRAKLWALLNTTWGAVLTVTPGASSGPSLSALSLSPTSVTGGGTSQGTVTLTGAAPSGGSVVALSSSNTAAATVPASVTVPAGSTSRTFTVSTQAVSSSTSATITATLGVTRTATLAVNAGTSSAPAAPTLVAPANGASVTLPVTLDWSAVTSAASYQVQVDDSSTFSSPFVVDQTVTASQHSVTTLAFRQHWWRVRARNSSGTAGAWSSVRSFTPQGSTPPPSGSATLTVTASGRSGERITSSPTGINVSVGSTGSAAFAAATSITLTVSNGRDAIWSGACSSSGSKRRSCTFTLNANASVTANVQ